MFWWRCATTNTRELFLYPKKSVTDKTRQITFIGAADMVLNHFSSSKPRTGSSKKLCHRDGQMILERVLFKHASENVYLLADAYDGRNIKECMEDILNMSSGKLPIDLNYKNTQLKHWMHGSCGH